MLSKLIQRERNSVRQKELGLLGYAVYGTLDTLRIQML